MSIKSEQTSNMCSIVSNSSHGLEKRGTTRVKTLKWERSIDDVQTERTGSCRPAAQNIADCSNQSQPPTDSVTTGSLQSQEQQAVFGWTREGKLLHGNSADC